jgi:hypothetical protein
MIIPNRSSFIPFQYADARTAANKTNGKLRVELDLRNTGAIKYLHDF